MAEDTDVSELRSAHTDGCLHISQRLMADMLTYLRDDHTLSRFAVEGVSVASLEAWRTFLLSHLSGRTTEIIAMCKIDCNRSGGQHVAGRRDAATT